MCTSEAPSRPPPPLKLNEQERQGAVKWTYFHLYVILDVFSRYVVGWMVVIRESPTLAEKLIH